MVIHSNLTGTDLHEPKGIASATATQVYVSDGVGSGSWQDFSALVGNTQRFVGEFFWFTGSIAPALSLIADGSTISRVTYSALNTVYSASGYPYGNGDGVTTFTLPDLLGRTPAGKETTATRLTSGVGGVDGATLGATGGSQSHVLTEAQLAQHDHTATTTTTPNRTSWAFSGNNTTVNDDPGAGQSVVFEVNNDGLNIVSNTTIQNAGSNEAHPNVQPTIILLPCIFTGV